MTGELTYEQVAGYLTKHGLVAVSEHQLTVLRRQAATNADAGERQRLEDVVRATAEVFGIDRTTLCGPRKPSHYVRARAIGMHFANRTLVIGLGRIGAAFGGRDHTTVLHSVRNIDMCLQDERYRRDALQDLSVVQKAYCAQHAERIAAQSAMMPAIDAEGG